MATIRRFEDIEAWQRARRLTKRIYEVTRQGEFARDFALKNQIREASVAIMANIAEGFERGGDREFRQFLSVAKGSTGEVKSHLYVALDANMVAPECFEELYQESTETGLMIGGFMKYLGAAGLRGSKYSKDASGRS